MKVLVTGATGFIGNHVARMCLEQGDEVRAMVLPGEDRSPLKGLDVEIVEGDLLKPETLGKAVEGVEGIYHLAAIYAVWTKDPTLQYRVNVDGTRALFEEALKRKKEIRKIVFTSSIAAIGVYGDGRLADETTPFNQWRYGNDYVLSKFISEQVVRGMVARGLPAVIVNPAYPFGPGDRMPTPTGKLIVSILKGEMKYYFEGGISAVDVRDVARGHLLAMEKGKIGEGYILANRDGNYTFRDFARLVGRIAGVRDVAKRKIPSSVLGAAGRAMELVAEVTGKPPQSTYKTSMYSTQNIWFDPSKAINKLGWPQTPVEVSVSDAVDWFRRNGYV
ncbi:MAG: NAD-dependent epimerase/dehydratase family protein [Candidatus Dadabacteria bacterium]|nr:MAG: NAD-dependent epimerase/dehydratase family protein [Candidatus Dadabacteria bacterium]